MYTPNQLLELYKSGENIIKLLKENSDYNAEEIIEIAYDLQSGKYIELLSSDSYLNYKKQYSEELYKVINSLCDPVSILEAGVGEATTLKYVLSHFKHTPKSFGFDLSWSRVSLGKRWLQDQGFGDVVLTTGNLFNIPFKSNSIDIVYTSHSIEPNAGNEMPILNELYRVARKYLVLLEPGYEYASEESRKRMDSLGYCKGIPDMCKKLGFKVLKNELFPYSSNPLNPTAITIIGKKYDHFKEDVNYFACPKYQTPLIDLGDVFFSPDGLVGYPVISGIPCLRIENGVLMTQCNKIYTFTELPH